MDPVTHSAAGAFIAWALPRRWAVAEATPVAVAGALLPDVDLYIEPFLKPGSAFEHRAFTHSLFGIAVLAPLIALVHLWRNKERRYARFGAVAAMGMLSHVVLDLPTELGAKVLYPFYDKIVYVDWLGHIDFTFFMLALFVLPVGLDVRQSRSRCASWNLIFGIARYVLLVALCRVADICVP
jgi:inner membrane protein